MFGGVNRKKIQGAEAPPTRTMSAGAVLTSKPDSLKMPSNPAPASAAISAPFSREGVLPAPMSGFLGQVTSKDEALGRFFARPTDRFIQGNVAIYTDPKDATGNTLKVVVRDTRPVRPERCPEVREFTIRCEKRPDGYLYRLASVPGQPMASLTAASPNDVYTILGQELGFNLTPLQPAKSDDVPIRRKLRSVKPSETTFQIAGQKYISETRDKQPANGGQGLYRPLGSPNGPKMGVKKMRIEDPAKVDHVLAQTLFERSLSDLLAADPVYGKHFLKTYAVTVETDRPFRIRNRMGQVVSETRGTKIKQYMEHAGGGDLFTAAEHFARGEVPMVEGDKVVYKSAQPAERLRVMKDIIRQMLDALSGLEKYGIVHRDIKPENVLLTVDSDGKLLVKLADFGLAHYENDQKSAKSGYMTVCYGSPEVTLSAAGEKTDIYAFGSTVFSLFFAMLAGTVFPELIDWKKPFATKDYLAKIEFAFKGRSDKVRATTAQKRILENLRVVLMPQLNQKLGLAPKDASAIDLIYACMQADPARRPNLAELKESAFLRS